jgi:uncharacterized protein YbjT (DUF2867 family)
MRKIKNVAIIGATGKSGKYLFQRLLNTPYHLIILLRNPENFLFKHDKIVLIKGDARDPLAIQSLLQQADAVVRMLGQPAGEPSIFSTATSNIIRGMN